MGIYSPLQDATRNESITVSTTSKTISDSRNQDNPRQVVVIRNISPNAIDIITIHQGANPAVTDIGIVLKQYESYSDSKETGYDAFQGTINAICATVNGVLTVFER